MAVRHSKFLPSNSRNVDSGRRSSSVIKREKREGKKVDGPEGIAPARNNGYALSVAESGEEKVSSFHGPPATCVPDTVCNEQRKCKSARRRAEEGGEAKGREVAALEQTDVIFGQAALSQSPLAVAKTAPGSFFLITRHSASVSAESLAR